jgi:hypothetical protein
MARCPSDPNKKVRILYYLYYCTSILVNIDKEKVMIIKSKKIAYKNIASNNNNLEEVNSYKYLGVYLHQLRKGLMEDGKPILS